MADAVDVARRVIRPGSVLAAAFAAVTALIRAGLLPPENELAAAPRAYEAIVQLQATAETYSAINPGRAARAVVTVLQEHGLLTQPGQPKPLATASTTEEPAA